MLKLYFYYAFFVSYLLICDYALAMKNSSTFISLKNIKIGPSDEIKNRMPNSIQYYLFSPSTYNEEKDEINNTGRHSFFYAWKVSFFKQSDYGSSLDKHSDQVLFLQEDTTDVSAEVFTKDHKNYCDTLVSAEQKLIKPDSLVISEKAKMGKDYIFYKNNQKLFTLSSFVFESGDLRSDNVDELDIRNANHFIKKYTGPEGLYDDIKTVLYCNRFYEQKKLTYNEKNIPTIVNTRKHNLFLGTVFLGKVSCAGLLLFCIVFLIRRL